MPLRLALDRWPRPLLLVATLLMAGAAGAAELTVSAAASLTLAFNEIARAYEAAHPGDTVRLNVAASGVLLQQIAHGAPVDVFASADQETMDQAAQQRLLKAGTRADFARNTLVVVVPSDASATPRRLADLAAGPFRRIAVGVPASVPVGRYTRAVLEQAQLWSAIEPKTVGAQSVRQALDYVARGEADAGFVYGTDAASAAGKVKVAFTVPTGQPVLYPIAVLADTRHDAAARAFVAHVRSPAGQAILARHGFGTP